MTIQRAGFPQDDCTLLEVGTLTDGEFLKRSGATITSAASAPPSGAAGGDLTGTYPDPTIGNDKVTYAKMQNVSATDKVLGRSTAGAGDIEEIPCTSAGRAILAGSQGAAIADADGTLADATTKINAILARLRAATPYIAT